MVDQQTNRKLGLLFPLLIFLALVPLFYFALYEEKEEIPSPLIGKQIPDFLLPDLHGKRLIDRSELMGEAFLLNVWGSWCPSCYVEHPFLSALQEQGVKIVGLNYKDEQQLAIRFLQDLGNPYALVIYDEKGDFALELGVYGAPETYLVDADGFIVHKRVGELNASIWEKQFAGHWSQVSKSE